MSDNDKYHQLYDRLLEEVGFLHQRIKVGIRQGLKMLVIVPLLFMVLMFLTNGSKGIFLIFWILSTFVIAAFLIALEYVDHGIQKRMAEIIGIEQEMFVEDALMPSLSGLSKPRQPARRALIPGRAALTKEDAPEGDAPVPDAEPEAAEENAVTELPPAAGESDSNSGASGGAESVDNAPVPDARTDSVPAGEAEPAAEVPEDAAAPELAPSQDTAEDPAKPGGESDRASEVFTEV
ncbi:MAG: hypothetical protein SO014_08135 [Candidatus Limivicinus sp.]|nr:hypothetical protein [Clostridiales bacterium]MDY3860586.1 hypothetical protein [Candidatus Limivicinus sp.]